ncbi:PP2C family protein-serine/threonine phosphatase [Leptospira ilyithenensis]|uniref:PPM-type phosphatase domain-containing protein n=1 Tax=Leptospira ilyithenensis TaxID=2484901 RepID=A0A4R9LRD6_9LEPT|nr:SpoIIE family protein phosphatase [Leptospira ilyithenensis]TGN13367.1 hypothetical protein EHS11_03815 [Leptospira ilyithenensis]
MGSLHLAKRFFPGLFVSLLFCFGCSGIEQIEANVEDGFSDLSSYKIDDPNVFQLDGTWEFYWNDGFEDIKDKNKILSDSFIPVPGSWIESGRYPKEGKAVYRLNVITKADSNVLALKLYEFPESYRLYVNRRLIYENGKYSIFKENRQRSLVRPFLSFPNDNGKTEIIIEAINFEDKHPGPRRPILFGLEKNIRKVQNYQLFTDVFSLGILSVMGVYHLGLFLLRRKDKGVLLFGIFCLTMSFRILVTEEHYLHQWFPEMNGFFEQILDVSSFLVLPPILIGIFSTFFRNEVDRKYLPYIYFTCLFLSLSFLITRWEFIFITYLALAFVIGLYLFYVLLRCVNAGRIGSRVFLLGWLVFIGTVVWDLLSYTNIIRNIYISHLGFLFFIISQAYFLSIKFDRALSTAEELTEKLDLKVQERTSELNQSLELIRSDLNMAKKIQEAILRKRELKLNRLKVTEVSIPFSEIGGDIYFVREISPGYVRTFIADATGHGVQAALITMMIISECEKRINSLQLPSEVLKSINENYTNKYNELNLFFTCFILDFDFTNQLIHYSSAGHPIQYLVRDSEIISLKTKGRLIGYHESEEYSNSSLPIKNADKVFLFTDGLYEESDKEGDIFGESRLKDTISKNSFKNSEDIIGKILEEVQKFRDGQKNLDDITILGLDLLESNP